MQMRSSDSDACPLCHDAPRPISHCCPWHPHEVACVYHAQLMLCRICHSEYTPMLDMMPVAVFVPDRVPGPPHGRPAPVMVLPRRKRGKKGARKRGRNEH